MTVVHRLSMSDRRHQACVACRVRGSQGLTRVACTGRSQRPAGGSFQFGGCPVRCRGRSRGRAGAWPRAGGHRPAAARTSRRPVTRAGTPDRPRQTPPTTAADDARWLMTSAGYCLMTSAAPEQGCKGPISPSAVILERRGAGEEE